MCTASVQRLPVVDPAHGNVAFAGCLVLRTSCVGHVKVILVLYCSVAAGAGRQQGDNQHGAFITLCWWYQVKAPCLVCPKKSMNGNPSAVAYQQIAFNATMEQINMQLLKVHLATTVLHTRLKSSCCQAIQVSLLVLHVHEQSWLEQ